MHTEIEEYRSQFDKQLIKAYLNAHYFVNDWKNPLKIGIYNEDLHAWISNNGLTRWIYFTSYNPKSSLLSITENKKRHIQLLKSISTSPTLTGYSCSPDGNWKEESLLIGNYTVEEGIRLGIRWQQNAFLRGDHSAIPKLVDIRHLLK